MGQRTSHPSARSLPQRKKRVIPQDNDRTKFDKWLERMREDRSPVLFNFALPPTIIHTNALQWTCQVIDVDRFNLFLEFGDGQCFWVNKSVIVSAGAAEDV